MTNMAENTLSVTPAWDLKCQRLIRFQDAVRQHHKELHKARTISEHMHSILLATVLHIIIILQSNPQGVQLVIRVHCLNI